MVGYEEEEISFYEIGLMDGSQTLFRARVTGDLVGYVATTPEFHVIGSVIQIHEYIIFRFQTNTILSWRMVMLIQNMSLRYGPMIGRRNVMLSKVSTHTCVLPKE